MLHNITKEKIDRKALFYNLLFPYLALSNISFVYAIISKFRYYKTITKSR